MGSVGVPSEAYQEGGQVKKLICYLFGHKWKAFRKYTCRFPSEPDRGGTYWHWWICEQCGKPMKDQLEIWTLGRPS